MLTEKEKKVLLDIVRRAVRTVIDGEGKESAISKDLLSEPLQERKGAFVAIYNGNTLRGCIGTVLGVLPLWQVCKECAAGAALKDSRFSPVSRHETTSLSFEITIINALRKFNDVLELRPGKDGLILKKGFRREAFLPRSLSDLLKSSHSLLDDLKVKAGIEPDDDSPELWEIFEAEVISRK